MDANSSALKFNNNWEGAGTDVMTLNNNGNAVITGNLNVASVSTDSIASRGTNGPLTIDPNFSTNNYVLIYDRLQVSGSFYVSSTIQSSGSYYFPNDTWNYTNDGGGRMFFSSSDRSYWKGGNGGWFNICHEWRRMDNDGTLMYLNNQGLLVVTQYGTTSDARIKKDIEDIDDNDGLNKILLIEPKKYNYVVDEKNIGRDGKVIGFIAQQIRQVIPEAVSLQEGTPPNIYKTCLIYNKREIYHSIPQDVPIDTEVSIKDKRYKIKEIYDDYFVIDEDIEGDEVFVYGYMVKDFHAIDKDSIFTLNVCATQELHRRMEAQNVIIKSQDERIKELEAKVERLLNYIS